MYTFIFVYMNNDSFINSDAYSDILDDIKEKIKKGNIIIFLGAGFSAPLGYPTAQNLSESLCNKYKININYNLPETVDYLIKNKNIKKCDIIKFISELIKPDEGKINNNPYHILREIIDENKSESKIFIFTTNWDNEINSAFDGISYIIKNKRDYVDYENNLKNNINAKVIIIKLHGDINDEKNFDDIIITEDDIKKNVYGNQQIYNILSGAIGNNIVLFMGYSLKDPEIENIYKTMRSGVSKPLDYFVTLDVDDNNTGPINIVSGMDSFNFMSDLYFKITNNIYLKNIEFELDETIKKELTNNKPIIICGAKYTGKTMMKIRLFNELRNHNYNVLGTIPIAGPRVITDFFSISRIGYYFFLMITVIKEI